MLQRIKNVQPQSGRRLLVEFENGEKKHYDIRGAAAQWEAFWALLTDKELFAQVQVDTGATASAGMRTWSCPATSCTRTE